MLFTLAYERIQVFTIANNKVISTQLLLLTKLTRKGHKTVFLVGTWRLLQIITSTFMSGGIVRNPV